MCIAFNFVLPKYEKSDSDDESENESDASDQVGNNASSDIEIGTDDSEVMALKPAVGGAFNFTPTPSNSMVEAISSGLGEESTPRRLNTNSKAESAPKFAFDFKAPASPETQRGRKVSDRDRPQRHRAASAIPTLSKGSTGDSDIEMQEADTIPQTKATQEPPSKPSKPPSGLYKRSKSPIMQIPTYGEVHDHIMQLLRDLPPLPPSIEAPKLMADVAADMQRLADSKDEHHQYMLAVDGPAANHLRLAYNGLRTDDLLMTRDMRDLGAALSYIKAARTLLDVGIGGLKGMGLYDDEERYVGETK